MPRAIAMPMRRAILDRHRQGQSLGQIAQQLQLPYNTVRQIWRRGRDQGEADLKPYYDRCGRRGPRSDRRILRAACWLKRRHPSWGGGLIRVILGQRWPDRPRPAVRTLQRAFRRVGLNPPPRRPPPHDPRRAGQVHEVWQVDAVDRAELSDGHRASWLTITDEHSGAILGVWLSPPRDLESSPGRRGPRRPA